MTDRVGQRLGNYRLTRLLGKGGFAEVYLGEHLRLGTHATVKVLYTRLASPEEVISFEKEAQIIAHLKHPHIVRVFDFDVQDDTPFLVMDYAVSGTQHQRHPKGTTLPLPTIINYVKQVTEALQYAHDQKLIHRDVKPENMLVGEREELLLSDFGIALIAQSSRYQGTQGMAGTITYMAPEQIEGKPRPASDQYALGIVVYEWLSGDRPFRGSYSEIAVQHTITPPPPLCEKVPTILPDVEHVVMTSLAKDPKQRFANVQAFANALKQASQTDAATFVKPPAPVVQHTHVVTPLGAPMVQPPRTTIPPNLPRKLLVTPPPPLKQPTADIKPVGTLIFTYRGHSNAVRTVAWSLDGQRIASRGHDKTVQVWDATPGGHVFLIVGMLKMYWKLRGRPMGGASPRGVLIEQCKCGMPPMETMCSLIVGIPMLIMGCMQWHGRLTDSASPRAAVIRRCRYGRQGEDCCDCWAIIHPRVAQRDSIVEQEGKKLTEHVF
jgi:eukaryotic-like serine/threonine-protein kinase